MVHKEIFWKKSKSAHDTRINYTATMADEEVLFDDVYELCEIIGKWVYSGILLQSWNNIKFTTHKLLHREWEKKIFRASKADVQNKWK